MSYAYEASDRTHCVINTIQVNMVEHKFYDECEEYKELVDQVMDLLAEAYQVAGKVCDFEESEDKLYLEDQCLKLKTELSKVKQMSFWKRLVFLFKGSVE